MISFDNLLITLKELKKDINKLNNNVLKLEMNRRKKIIKIQKSIRMKKKRQPSGFQESFQKENH